AQAEQGEALWADRRLVAGGVHVPRQLGLVYRRAVLVGQQGGDRRRAAAEVVLLAYGGAEAGFLEAGHRHRVTATVRHAQVDRPRRRRGRWRQQRREQQHVAHGHGPPWKCTLTAVPCWISTFDPLFWITVVSPAALANAPPSIQIGRASCRERV